MNRNSAPSAPRAFETLEGRQLFAVTIGFIAPDTLTFTGDWQTDVAQVFDNGAPAGMISGSVSNAFGAMVPFGPVPGIRKVHFDMGDNNDRVTYTVTGDMLFGSVRYISASMGNGIDRFHLDMTNDIDLGPNSYVNVRASGGAGNDSLIARYSGELDGQLVLTQDGGAGNDWLHTNCFLDKGSSGRLTAGAYGGTEDDGVDMIFHKGDPLDPVITNCFASGGAGISDKLSFVAGVANDGTFEFLTLVP